MASAVRNIALIYCIWVDFRDIISIIIEKWEITTTSSQSVIFCLTLERF
jgi:hypothetical protein